MGTQNGGRLKFVNTQNLQVLNIYGYSKCVGSLFFFQASPNDDMIVDGLMN